MTLNTTSKEGKRHKVSQNLCLNSLPSFLIEVQDIYNISYRCTTVIQYFYWSYSILSYYKVMTLFSCPGLYILAGFFFVYSNLYLLIPYAYLAQPPFLLPTGNH